MDLNNLADELIQLRCGAHSLGNVYEYLLRAYCDTNRAKADFICFLSGDLPAPAIKAAADYIAEEQGSGTEAKEQGGVEVLLSGECLIQADQRQAGPPHG
jgi:hypothetical protein